MSRLKAIFTDDWQYILEVYHKYICPPGDEPVSEKLLLILLEIGVRFGERLSQYQTNGYVEIGCGLAIPSLTLAKLGRSDILAIDIDPKIITKAEEIK
jgi:2-polyprenyl-3-methyl-5-hydroxy-6-metoxy-1,4-benzoquinol methylase